MVDKYNDFILSNDVLFSQEEEHVKIQFLKFLDEIEEKLKAGEQFSALKESTTLNPRKKEQVQNKKQIQKMKNVSNQEDLRIKIHDLESKIKTAEMVTKAIAHTFNNLLSSILGYVSLLKMDYKNSEFYETLEEIEHSSLRARDLTSQLLTLIKNIDTQKEDISQDNQEQIEKDSHIFKGKGIILILDDEKTILDVSNKMLSRLGYHVSGAIFLEQAIEMYRDSIKKGRKYDAVILDLSELGGSEGYGFKLWKDVDPDINMIISSGYADDPIFENYEKFGVKAALKKPYDIAQLSKILHDVINSKENK
ncbi:MAG: hypothetical protein DRO88_14140 [Promethearchaeia archaeon]|nr:MAG: hypothetical protein DRO88_14140 [Candidatus Lokiarchaeia archaeon]